MPFFTLAEELNVKGDTLKVAQYFLSFLLVFFLRN